MKKCLAIKNDSFRVQIKTKVDNDRFEMFLVNRLVTDTRSCSRHCHQCILWDHCISFPVARILRSPHMRIHPLHTSLQANSFSLRKFGSGEAKRKQKNSKCLRFTWASCNFNEVGTSLLETQLLTIEHINDLLTESLQHTAH